MKMCPPQQDEVLKPSLQDTEHILSSLSQQILTLRTPTETFYLIYSDMRICSSCTTITNIVKLLQPRTKNTFENLFLESN